MNAETESIDLTDDHESDPSSYHKPYSVSTKLSFVKPRLHSYHLAGSSRFRVLPGGNDFSQYASGLSADSRSRLPKQPNDTRSRDKPGYDGPQQAPRGDYSNMQPESLSIVHNLVPPRLGQYASNEFPISKSLQLDQSAPKEDTVRMATESPERQVIQPSTSQRLPASIDSPPEKRRSLFDPLSIMATPHHDAYSTPQKKRKLHAVQSGDIMASPYAQGSSRLSKHHDATSPPSDTHAPVTPSQTPAPVGMFRTQARKQRNGIRAPLQPPVEECDQQDFMAAVHTAEIILGNLEDNFLRPMIDLATKVNSLERRVAYLQSENERLRQHVDVSFDAQATSTRVAVKEVNTKCEELVVRMDDVEGYAGPCVAGGAYGGPADTGRSRQPGAFHGLMSRHTSNSTI